MSSPPVPPPVPPSSSSQSVGQFASLRTDSSNFDLIVGAAPSALDEQRIQRLIEDKLIYNLQSQAALSRQSIFSFKDFLPALHSGMEALVADDFSRCFEAMRNEPWNFTPYLWVFWVMGVIVRHGILFPIRALSLLMGAILFALKLVAIKFLVKDPERRHELELANVRFFCSAFVFSWHGVIRYHGSVPAKRPNRIYVANHTSMIDMIVLGQRDSYSLVGQKHPGWVGMVQDYVLGCLGNAWFNRGEASDRLAVAKKMKAHIADPQANRLLVFPEGTCVNNEYVVQFKQGVFDMNAEVCPIAIKYNKIFVDAFWNSRQQSFASHLVDLMCSWAVVCDVYYLDPQSRRSGETAIDFSNRVKKLIARRAGLKNVEWDGYLKHFRPSARYVQEQQSIFANQLLKKLNATEIAHIQNSAARVKQHGGQSEAAALAGPAVAPHDADGEAPMATLRGTDSNLVNRKMAAMISASSTVNLAQMAEEETKKES